MPRNLRVEKRFSNYIMNRLVLFIFIFFVGLSPKIYGDCHEDIGPTKIQALNNYVMFINESIHGMVIVHRLLENYNQDLNKYVDLEGYQINNFGNKDLPSNIFEDPDDWFYPISPNEWYAIAKDGASVLTVQDAQELNVFLDRLYQKIKSINAIRFEIEDFLQNKDLTQKENIESVYEFLEKGTDLYDSFFEDQTKLEVILIKFSREYDTHDPELLDIVQAFDKTWFASKNILRAVRDKKDELLPGQVAKLDREIATMAAIDITKESYVTLNSPKPLRSWKQALSKLGKISSNTKLLIETAEIPIEYKFYGKFYYFHNAVLTNQMNRYGSGFAHEMNLIIKEADIQILYRIEEPHFYQVIYPKKLIADEVIASSDDNIVIVPTKLKDREIIKSTRTIKVDTMIFDITLYDHKIVDGDIVSINFNGDWILEQYSLEGIATNLKLRLNKEGKNYLLLHAENEGRNPPNTMAVAYMYNGEKQIITLSSNLAESEMIEILYDGGE